MRSSNLLGILVSLISLPASAQQMLSETEAIQKALANSKNIRAASLQVRQQEQLLKSTVNLPNPEFFIESPTGNFYTGSITQSIEFPTVYKNQYRLQQQQIGVAQKEKQLTEAALKYQVKLLYLEAQFADSLSKQLYIQDTLYERIQASAVRQFAAGQIDYLQQTFAETQYGEIHLNYLQSLSKARSANAQLQWMTGIKEPILVQPLVLNGILVEVPYRTDSSLIAINPSFQLLQQQTAVAQQNIALQKSKSLPGLAFGYFNQGERTTPFINRFRFGFTIPLWFGQYKANIAAAKTEEQVFQSKQQGLHQELNTQLINAENEVQIARQSVNYYQQTGARKASEMLRTLQRFFVSGEIDYISLLRNSNEAYSIYQKHLEAIRNYNRGVLNYQYLMGQL